jgi:hypothetical protein
MKTNHFWIKTDYKVQTGFGLVILALIVATIVSFLLTQSFALGLIVAFLLMPLGAWQVISGLIYAFNGDRLQQIYLGVVALYFTIGYGGGTVYHSDYLPIMLVVALIIAIWKYTVVRADYISLNIISVPHTEHILDA